MDASVFRQRRGLRSVMVQSYETRLQWSFRQRNRSHILQSKIVEGGASITPIGDVLRQKSQRNRSQFLDGR
jgi:hypothetical protein